MSTEVIEVEVMKKPHIYHSAAHNSWVCSMVVAGKPTHGYGGSIRLAYLDWCVNVYGAAHPHLE